ncbi:MAG TPA: alpha-glucuronidase family glycosyl hydrolase [Terriglobales bacterium]|nr:alpha-glucuronidase family glycosyl hydrolase [Terriglobales bacterium]
MTRTHRLPIPILLLSCVLLAAVAHAETGEDAWLRYAPFSAQETKQYETLPSSLVVLGDSPLLKSAQQELTRGIKGMLGRTLASETSLSSTPGAIVLGTADSIHSAIPDLQLPALHDDGYWLANKKLGDQNRIIIAGGSDRGALYGAFALLQRIALGENLDRLDETEQPYAPIRWVDQWDNLDGRIERGYGGRSIFFDSGSVRSDLTRASEYARLLASIGINGCTVNNVNADPHVLDDAFLPQLARIAEVFRPWGVKLSISVDFSSPKVTGGLQTFDPLDPQVAEWWSKKVDSIYRQIPDFAGFVVKADSEGRLGPATYGRTPADAANVTARALKPHGGIVFYRAFVYNHHLDWRDPKNDRAKAAYDNFHPLDGKFDDNVIIQIKNGPIDFQVREPVSPLFSGLEKTNEAIELQITQEYLGQGRHMVFLPPMWKETLDFDLHANAKPTLTKEIVAGRSFHRPTGGFVGVANVGMDPNWLAHPLAMANLYGFGRLAWNPDLSLHTIAEDWTRLTFGNDPLVVHTISAMQLASWRIYEDYTGPLGVGTLTNITGPHYGPGIESSEGNGWGQWHRGDHEGIGMDRTMATGTGYTAQYSPQVAQRYETLKSTPDEVLLFFHHVPYTYVLHSGKTLIQHVYDSHYQGAEAAEAFVRQWQTLKGHIDDARYSEVLARLEYQSGHAIVWRDAICGWFLRISSIADAKGRAGHFPDRIEAESALLKGYQPVEITPSENASGGKAIQCPVQVHRCQADFKFSGPSGSYEIDVQYFDMPAGQAKFRLLVGDKPLDEWIAGDNLPARAPGGDSSTRRRITGINFHQGDVIRIEGTPDQNDPAALDYIEIRSTADAAAKRLPIPVFLTAEQDHQRTMELLHISSLRPGPSGNPQAPNAANTDESKVDHHPKLPDPLTLKDGKKVTTPEMWWKHRRPEIVEDFDREIYGRVPKDTPHIWWEVTSSFRETNGNVPVITKELIGHVDNSADPLIDVQVQLTLTTPASASGPVPVIMEFGLSPEVMALFARRFRGGFAGLNTPGPTWQQQVLAKGWGYAILIPTSYQADNGDGLTAGIIGLTNRGQPRKLDDWGALRAWAWGASRASDYFETDPSVDARRVGIEGLSRYGKAALVTMAYDQRFAIGFIGSSGEGGAKLYRRNFGEQVENLASSGGYHWMAGNFLKYAGPLTTGDLPIDAHELIALCAPRPVFISTGAPKVEGGWVDAKGMFLGAVGAGPVYKLLGKKDLGTIDVPPIETALIDGDIAFRSHAGGHTTGPNWPTFLSFAERYLNSQSR